MIPREYLIPYLISNGVALAVLGLAFVRPRWVRWVTIALFLWAALRNTQVVLTTPESYQGFAPLTFLPIYRDFIQGWFRQHTMPMVLTIAACQLTIALLLLVNRHGTRRLGVSGALAFLLGIAPLGVGSAFPFSLIYGSALVIMLLKLEHARAA